MYFFTWSDRSVAHELRIHAIFDLKKKQKEESWAPTPLVAASTMNGVVNIGVYLPPWETKCKIMALMPMNGQVTAAVAFIHALQQSAPGLQPDSFSIPRQWENRKLKIWKPV